MRSYRSSRRLGCLSRISWSVSGIEGVAGVGLTAFSYVDLFILAGTFETCIWANVEMGELCWWGHGWLVPAPMLVGQQSSTRVVDADLAWKGHAATAAACAASDRRRFMVVACQYVSV
jgi:hypothetical protein